jgi:putative ABC transport system permease protein
MVGVALVTFVSIFASGVGATIAKTIDNNLDAAFVVQNTDGFSPFSANVLQSVDRVNGVSDVSAVRFSQARVRGVAGETPVSGIDPRTFTKLYTVSAGEEALAGLRPGQAVLSKDFAKKNSLEAGQPLQVTTAVGRRIVLNVAGIADDKGDMTTAVTVTNSQMLADFGEPKDAFGMVGVDPGADEKQVQADVKRLLDRRFPEAEVLTADQFKDNIAGQVNQLLYLIYALLALAIIVSLFGIVNTLVLSISERTRELGLLRAIGTTRRQVKRVVRYEAVITSLIGGVLGVVVGLVLAILFTQPLNDFTLSIPVVSLIVLLVLAGLAGVGAAILPARRAAKLDVLDALAYE